MTRVCVDIQSIKSIICNQNRVLKALMSGVDDTTAMPHVNGDIFNVYIYHIQNENRERNWQ